jgi:hypothetical protein
MRMIERVSKKMKILMIKEVVKSLLLINDLVDFILVVYIGLFYRLWKWFDFR